MSKSELAEPGTDDDGFGLVEILVSMFLLALIAIAFLPVLVSGLQQSARNATLATATQLVHARMELARNADPECAAVTSLAGATTTTDPRGVTITVTTTAASCPATYPGTVRVSASAVRGDTGAEVARAATLVFVEGS